MLSVAARLRTEIAAHRLEFDRAQQAAAQRLDRLRESLAAPRSWRARILGRGAPAPRGLYLWGGVGRGKTLLMDWFHAGLDPRRSQRLHFYQFMRRVHAELAAAQRHANPLELVGRAMANDFRVLCIDEFFVADIADAMILGALMAALFARGVVLVATSNTPPEELYKDGLQRARFLPAIDLLRGALEVIHMDGAVDHRLRRLEVAPTYFDANLPATAQEIARRFTALAGTAADGPAELEVEGRRLRTRGCGGGTVWFEFAELCEGPRSQNDYIELARLFDTVFITGIPRFDQYNEDAARRFIMLIDELYDRGVKTVVSAAAAPEALYAGERSREDFRRTRSRLVEMQTRSYLARLRRP